MAWVQLFPTNNTLISQSVNQIQQNWLFLQNNINTDHYFNSGAPSEGHHKFVHLPTQGADPAVILTGVVYQKNSPAGSPALYYRTGPSGITQVSTAYVGDINFAGPGLGNILNLNGLPRSMGILNIVRYNNMATRAHAYLYWDGAGLMAITDQSLAGHITFISPAGTNIQVTVDAACHLFWSYTKVEL